MLTDKEKEYFRELLERLELDDLLTLTDTVTNRVVSVETKQEAIEAILLFTVNASQLLRRKKMKREHLYHYLAQKGCIEAVTADKSQLCRRVLELWGSRMEEPEPDIDDYKDTAAQSTSNNTTNTQANNQSIIPTDGQTLAEHFTPWFYQILNSLVHEPSAPGISKDTPWGEHHFWDDAKCNITMMSEKLIQEKHEGSHAVSTKFAEVILNEKLYFHPNISGIKGEMDPHGLVKITVGGTVHRFSSCIGIFEQLFGLIQDPHNNDNWKIKFTNLRLKAQGAIEGSEGKALPGSNNGGKLALTS